jgi:hypothetical protein
MLFKLPANGGNHCKNNHRQGQHRKRNVSKKNNKIDNLRPPFVCEFSSRVRIVVDQVTGQKRGRNNQCVDHTKSVQLFVPSFNENDPTHYKIGSDGVESSVDYWKVLNGHGKNIRILWMTSCH